MQVKRNRISQRPRGFRSIRSPAKGGEKKVKHYVSKRLVRRTTRKRNNYPIIQSARRTWSAGDDVLSLFGMHIGHCDPVGRGMCLV